MLKHNYHIVTAFSRRENFEPLRKLLDQQPLQWHLLVDDPPAFQFEIKDWWIHRYPVPKIEPGWKMWRRCINHFAQQCPIAENDRYLILNDDGFYEPGFFEKIDAVDGDVLVCSMKRGDQTPPGCEPIRAHGTNTLEAKPENMHPGQVDVEQIVLSGILFKRINLIVRPDSDGYMVEQIVHDYGAVYLPGAYVWFNYLEPGRWNGVDVPGKQS